MSTDSRGRRRWPAAHDSRPTTRNPLGASAHRKTRRHATPRTRHTTDTYNNARKKFGDVLSSLRHSKPPNKKKTSCPEFRDCPEVRTAGLYFSQTENPLVVLEEFSVLFGLVIFSASFTELDAQYNASFSVSNENVAVTVEVKLACDMRWQVVSVFSIAT